MKKKKQPAADIITVFRADGYELAVSNPNSYQDVAVLEDVWNAQIAGVTPQLIRRARIARLKKYGTRLLIRVAERLWNQRYLRLDQGAARKATEGLFEFILDVLRFRVTKARYKDAFIDLEFNPNAERLHAFFLAYES